MMTGAPSLIDAQALTVRYGETTVLRDVKKMRVAPGEIVTIVGPNGSGKSTLISAILGGVTPATGAIERKPGLRIGYVPQRPVPTRAPGPRDP